MAGAAREGFVELMARELTDEDRVDIFEEPMAVCPDCGGRGWKLVGAALVGEPDKMRCGRCVGTGYVGLKESIASAGGVS